MEVVLKFFDKIKAIFKGDLIRVFSFTSISTLVRMITGFVSVKVVASLIGPSGVALVGQLNNFVTMGQNLASAGINNGITKYVAEFRFDNNIVKKYLSTSLRLVVFCSLLLGLCLIIANQTLSLHVMQSDEYSYLFIILGITIILFALNTLLISILNGYKEFKKYVGINIIGSIFGLVYTIILVFLWGLKGALISSVTFHSIMFFVTILMLRRLPWLNWEYFKCPFEKPIAKNLLKFTAMTLISASLVPITQMILRGYVITTISPVDAGVWEGMNRISNMYLSIITTSLAVYTLPRMSEISDKSELKKELLSTYKTILPLLFVGFLIIYFIKTPIIQILFTEEFLPMRNLFIWQLSGDFFKIISWLLGYLMLAKSMTKEFIITEFFYNALFLALAFIFIRVNGIIGITQAYLLNYIIYTLLLFVIFKLYFSKVKLS